MSGVIDAARLAYAAGLCVVPPAEDGSKRPLGAWKDYQTTRPTADTMRAWYGPCSGLGVILWRRERLGGMPGVR